MQRTKSRACGSSGACLSLGAWEKPKSMVSEHFNEVHMVNTRSDKEGKSFLFKGVYHQGVTSPRSAP